ncbi:hypothetical protein MIMGU_mgv1a017355mg [Erythranthe guttata]|uniref:Uncharacterized protein n=1 Tax=Erythranthe guttata TaxID=4155 RepID=A0A022QSN9_ERYGU|nr:hypothetical protein MIMGU_mgv1a017355mg [Erythranthe guttata]
MAFRTDEERHTIQVTIHAPQLFLLLSIVATRKNNDLVDNETNGLVRKTIIVITVRAPMYLNTSRHNKEPIRPLVKDKIFE